MKSDPIKLYETDKSNLPTQNRVIYYGCPDGYIYVLYQQNYKTPAGRDSIEFRVEYIQDFTFDYDNKRIYDENGKEIIIGFSNIPSDLDKPYLIRKLVKRFRRIKNYRTAERELIKMLEPPKMRRTKFPPKEGSTDSSPD